jgi:hypothetical protein
LNLVAQHPCPGVNSPAGLQIGLLHVVM